MGFLRRLLGDRAAGPQPLEPFDLPTGSPFGGFLELPDEFLYPTTLRRYLDPAPEGDWQNRDVWATLRHAPADGDRVAVEIDGRLAGYLPEGVSAAWATYVDALAIRGLAPRVPGELGASAGHWDERTRRQDRTIYKLRLLTKADADYPLPDTASDGGTEQGDAE